MNEENQPSNIETVAAQVAEKLMTLSDDLEMTGENPIRITSKYDLEDMIRYAIFIGKLSPYEGYAYVASLMDGLTQQLLLAVDRLADSFNDDLLMQIDALLDNTEGAGAG